MVRPTADHLRRRADRINAVERAQREKQRKEAAENLSRLRSELYWLHYAQDVEAELNLSAEEGKYETWLILPVDLEVPFKRHMSDLGLKVAIRRSADEREPIQHHTYPMVSKQHAEYVADWRGDLEMSEVYDE